MTFIVAGRLNRSSFIMSDCIGTITDPTSPYKHLFTEKIKRLSSNPAMYFAMAGTGFIAQFVDFYDNWLYSQGQKSDFVNNNNFLHELVEFIILSNQRMPKGPVALKSNRLFFISHEGLFFCDMNFDNANRLIGDIAPIKIDDGKCISSDIGYRDMRINIESNEPDDKNIKDFCLRVINNLAFGNNIQKKLLEKRIQFILLKENGVDIIEPAFQLPSDILVMAFEKSYEDLDNPDFAFSL